MKKLLLTAIVALASTVFMNAQTYFVGVQNCTGIAQLVNIEIVTNDGDCFQTGEVIGTVPANSFNYLPVQNTQPSISITDEIAWASAIAQCTGEVAAQGISPEVGYCTNLGPVTGVATCIGNYDLTVVPQNYAFNPCASGFLNNPGPSLGVIDIH